MEISPDHIIFWQWGFIKLNATIVFTWLVMFLLVLVSWLITRNLKVKPQISRWQNILEIIVDAINQQIREVSQQEPSQYLPFIGTLFLFIVVANMLTIVPGYQPPTGSLSTTAGLALCVFVAVPLFGILNRGLLGYLRNYIQPTPLMLPFNIISEFSRTLALAVRLFGNIMSGTMLVAILLSLVPLFFPILIRLLGLLIGIIQAYIFAILAMVYIASATRVYRRTEVNN
ncbi:F0F1 ATP synthase subunit A [Nodularia spumigena CS-584]|jgi:F-type H+-transporting ATPase subunit a|uniref:ATP synthase subunit a n=1 Tax=Nodularia spumigena UHCC 0060 TaxID=3110300 RepID=A0ABU5ULT0_NODSP|nr:F0F1 ATP synthase subunit A [Nodularia spumigena]AHJ26790.1 ATP synthase A chain [Nodularia spumigena CCY9414]EAW45276.1 ATP synthase subunit A [Nodularia spumigena CCY9414]MDB9382031.1 F0F1 ATP synthase subunit A [Nodularia spumigena CS-584]MEA5525853.1 F0F1 ATP synthase subunit A [Nodularia spumigena UHCC 0143]MEA5606957.1 F0F1 ATP synthase subunit A [Nodularia spumigena UHCC 0060]